MSGNATYYHIYSACDTPCNLAKDADAEAMKTWLCPGCMSPKPGVTSVDTKLNWVPCNVRLNMIFGADLGVATKKFLTTLGDDLVQRDLYLGRVYGPDGRELTKFVNFHGKHRVIVRGSK